MRNAWILALPCILFACAHSPKSERQPSSVGVERFLQENISTTLARWNAIPEKYKKPSLEIAAGNTSNSWICDPESRDNPDERAVHSYLRKVADRLLASVENFPVNHRVCVEPKWTRELSSTGYRNGIVEFNTSILLKAGFEDQWAFVLAHELSHYLLRHDVQVFAVSSDMWDACLTTDEDACRSAKKIENEMSTKVELEADRLAMVLLHKAGYRLSGAFDALRWIGLYAYGSTPPSSERRDSIQKVIEDLDLRSPLRFTAVPYAVQKSVKTQLKKAGDYPKWYQPYLTR